ncbi:MAG: hypothetical protein NC089_12340 [Bacteroides sp.]|nr:hypothetical protein [Bacteroides sp.]MCM1550273.1 hypothetical protein [Clostridium sp.]
MKIVPALAATGDDKQDFTQTLEARRYLGCVLYSLMYRYVLAGAKACLRGTCLLSPVAVAGVVR